MRQNGSRKGERGAGEEEEATDHLARGSRVAEKGGAPEGGPPAQGNPPTGKQREGGRRKDNPLWNGPPAQGNPNYKEECHKIIRPRQLTCHKVPLPDARDSHLGFAS